MTPLILSSDENVYSSWNYDVIVTLELDNSDQRNFILVILTLFFHNSLFIYIIKNLSVHFVLFFEIYQKPLSFCPMLNLQKVINFIIPEKRSQKIGF